jgi:hypothetical protein
MNFDEVKLQVNVFGFLTHHCILRICNGALVVLLDGGGLCDRLVKGFADELPEVDNIQPRMWIASHKTIVSCGS